MRCPIQFKNHPFRFLLYLEWILLAINALTAVIPPRRHLLFYEWQNSFPLIIVIIVIFGLMGLRLPTVRPINKIVYTAVEFVLIFLCSVYYFNIGFREIRLFPALYIILIIRSCLIFQLSGRLLITAISFISFLITIVNRFYSSPIPPFLQDKFKFVPLLLLLSFGLTLVFVLLMMNTMIAERQIREKLAIANEKLRQYALRIEDQATLQERNRIAREIHDSLGHSLTALNLQLETALKLWESNPTKAKDFLARAKELGSKSLQDVRNSVSTMRSYSLQGQSLEQAVSVLAEDVRRAIGVLPDYRINLLYSLPNEANTAIYRIVQEALTNICKHAQATAIAIDLTSDTTRLQLIISDNGKGFNIEQNTTGFGLQSMRDRVLALRGKFKIITAPGAGCRIVADIPLTELSNN
ncbi:MAG: sensor histidine kinase [Nostocaceae cyanobacterium]|nr:sensor histidine kinase [Nostocaceae cyanobacterium]